MKLKDRAYYTVVADDMEPFEGEKPPTRVRQEDLVTIIDGDAETLGLVRWDMAEEVCHVLNAACQEFMPGPDAAERSHVPVEEVRAMFADSGALLLNVLRHGPIGWRLVAPQEFQDLQDYYAAKEEGRVVPRHPEAGAWLARGFTERTVFHDGYTLLVNPKTLDKVRLYFDGRVLATDPETGRYGSDHPSNHPGEP